MVLGSLLSKLHWWGGAVLGSRVPGSLEELPHPQFPLPLTQAYWPELQDVMETNVWGDHSPALARWLPPSREQG